MKKTPVVLFGNMKGGSGKTTSTILSALAFAHAKFRVGLRDCDNQASLGNSIYQNVFADLPVSYAPAGTEENYDIILTDGPPRLNDPNFLDAFDQCTLFLLVTGTSTLDLQPTASAYKALTQRRADVPLHLIVNRYDKALRLDRDLEQHLAAVGLSHVPLIKPYITESEIYRHVVYGGWDTAARHARRPAAIDELKKETEALAVEIYRIVQKITNNERRRSA
jgi:cellulose biosynthesis protein BcsQ